MKANDELRRKLQQGSQQLQGEVLELALEDLISQTFPSDLVQPVPKGINGADIMQRVQNPNGDLAGSIIWESKRTKAWSDGWIQKIKDDQRQAKADIAIMVSDALPKDCNHFKQISGIWVIHNSDYRSMDVAKAAIDRYFEDRNANFQKHPKRAGKKIWGSERELSAFSDANNCKDPHYR